MELYLSFLSNKKLLRIMFNKTGLKLQTIKTSFKMRDFLFKISKDFYKKMIMKNVFSFLMRFFTF